MPELPDIQVYIEAIAARVVDHRAWSRRRHRFTGQAVAMVSYAVRRSRSVPMQKILLAVALVLGGLIAYVDSRPTWDDTGITAVAVFLTCGMLAFMGPKRPWLWALAVGVWIPLMGILWTRNYGSLLALVIAFAGAYAGMAARNAVSPART